jgi:hypothetical protein
LTAGPATATGTGTAATQRPRNRVARGEFWFKGPDIYLDYVGMHEWGGSWRLGGADEI